MKKQITIAAAGVFGAALLLTSFSSGPGGAGQAKTGAPGEGTCVTCHAGAALNSGTGSVAISLGSGITTYIPGNTYTVTVTGMGSSVPKYGFQATAQQTSDGSQVGTFTAGTGSKVSVVASKSYVEQSSTSSTGVWTFQWQAPATNVGEVKFYVAGNSAENPGGTGGDNIYSSVLTLTAENSTSAVSVDTNTGLSVFPNPASDNVTVSFYSTNAETASITVLDLTGKTVATIADGQSFSAGLSTVNFNTSALSKGNYLVSVQTGKNVQTAKLVVVK